MTEERLPLARAQFLPWLEAVTTAQPPKRRRAHRRDEPVGVAVSDAVRQAVRRRRQQPLYGAWKGGSKASGGHPVEPKAETRALTPVVPADALPPGKASNEPGFIVDPDAPYMSPTINGQLTAVGRSSPPTTRASQTWSTTSPRTSRRCGGRTTCARRARAGWAATGATGSCP